MDFGFYYRPQLKDDSDSDIDIDDDDDDSHADHHEMVGLNHRIQGTPEGSDSHSTSAAGSGSSSSSSSSFDSHYVYSQQPQSRAFLPAWYRSPIGRQRSRPSLICSRLPAALKSAWCIGIGVVVATAVLVATMPTIVSVLENKGNKISIHSSTSDNNWDNDGIAPMSVGVPLGQKMHEYELGNNENDDDEPRHHQSPPNHDSPVEIREGITSGTGGTSLPIPYLHVAASDTHRNGKPQHLVLLHGAAFDKETWRTSGILSDFGTRIPWLSVTALDLPVSADYHKLVGVLKDLHQEGIVESLPVAALVSPSASGRSVTSWICNNNNNNDNNSDKSDELPLSKITDYFRLWIPVASYAVLKCPEEDLSALAGGQGQGQSLAVVAVYGDRDGRGKTVSETLGKHAGATVYELSGRHPVYLDEPLKFVDKVGAEIRKLPAVRV